MLESLFFLFSPKGGVAAILSNERELFIKSFINAGYLKLSGDSGYGESAFSLGAVLWTVYFSHKISNGTCKLSGCSHVLVE